MIYLSKNKSARHLLQQLAAWFFILLWCYTAISKILDFETFRLQLAQSPLLSAFAGFLAWGVPLVEVGIALLLAIPKYRLTGLFASFFLMVAFTTYIFIILNFADFVPCSCGGVLENLSWSQHLAFNGIFILLAAFAITATMRYNLAKTSLLLTSLTFFGMAMVALLFVSSEKRMHRNNAFQRRYLPHPIEKISHFNLGFDSYYIAGIDDSIVYLGNYSAPLYVTKINTKSGEFETIQLYISRTDLPYQRVRIVVQPPYFFVGDGTIPILFRGKIEERRAIPYNDQGYFTDFIVADSATIGLKTISSATQNTALAAIHKVGESSILTVNHDIITAQTDGIFDSDGILLWNAKHQRFIYVYRYRNSYENIDKNLSPLHTGKTIDTLHKAIVDVAFYSEDAQYKLGANTVTVNKAAATANDFLFIESERLGRFEEDSNLETAAIIDTYSFKDNRYHGSFYIYHEPSQTVRDIQTANNTLVVIIDATLQLYRLKPEHFGPGSN